MTRKIVDKITKNYPIELTLYKNQIKRISKGGSISIMVDLGNVDVVKKGDTIELIVLGEK